MTGRGMRWGWLAGAVLISGAIAFGTGWPWSSLGEGTNRDTDGAAAWPWIAFVLATTAGVRGSWTRLVAAVVAVVPTALLCTGWIASFFAEYGRVKAKVLTVLVAWFLAVLLVAVVDLLRGGHRFYHRFVVGVLGVPGALVLLGAALDPESRWPASLVGAGYILAGVFAALAARGVSTLALHPDQLSAEPQVTSSTERQPHKAAPEGQLRSMWVCGAVGVLMTGLGVLVGYAIDTPNTAQPPDNPLFPTLPGLSTGSPLPIGMQGASKIPSPQQVAGGASPAQGVGSAQ